MTPEEAASEARKKKIQSFKLHVDDFGFADASPKPNSNDRVGSESVNDILKDIASTVNASKTAKKQENQAKLLVAEHLTDHRRSVSAQTARRKPQIIIISRWRTIQQKFPKRKNLKIKNDLFLLFM